MRAANALAFTSSKLPSCLPASHAELPGSRCTVPMVWVLLVGLLRGLVPVGAAK